MRETWGHNPEGPGVVYRADGDFDMKFHGDRWRPSIHMPRWASRITLEVTEVRVQRLQDISATNAKAEGWGGFHDSLIEGDDPLCMGNGPRTWFYKLWESINGPGSWNVNPWVWVVTFKPLAP